MTRRLAPIIAVLAGVLLFAAAVLRLPYFSEGPGPTYDVLPLITIDGAETYPVDGKLLLTTVSFSAERLTPLQMLIAWLDPHTEILAERDFLTPGLTLEEENELERFAMDRSQLDATAAALTALGDYPKERGPGALVERTLEGCEAEGRLFPGNVITEIDGLPVNGRTQAAERIEAADPGKPIVFTAQAGAKEVEVEVARTECGPHGEPLVGVLLVNNFPFDVDIDSAGVGGPSAGLMFALGVYDKLTPGDLTGGRTIAGTGEIGFSGKVYPIGGIEKKVYAAEAAGASMFFVPKDNYEAAKATGVDMILVPVETMGDALDALDGDTGSDGAKDDVTEGDGGG